MRTSESERVQANQDITESEGDRTSKDMRTSESEIEQANRQMEAGENRKVNI